MTITNVGRGVAANNTTSPNPSFPAGGASGDLNVLYVHWKPTASTAPSSSLITTPANWIKLGEFSNGNFAPGSPPDDSGSVKVAVFVRIGAFTGSLGAITISNVSVASARIDIWRSTGGTGWQYNMVTHGGAFVLGPYSSDTSITAANLNLRSGDWLLSSTTVGDNEDGFFGPALTAAGVTLGSMTLTREASAIASPNAGLFWADMDAPVSSGTSTARPIATSGTSQNGVTAFVRLRDTTTDQVSSDNATATEALTARAIESTETSTAIDLTAGIPDIPTMENGDVVNADTMNRFVRDVFSWMLGISRPAVHLVGTDNQALGTGFTTIQWQASPTLLRGNISHTSTRVIIAEPGVYSGILAMGTEDIGTFGSGWDLLLRLDVYRAGVLTESIYNLSSDMDSEQSFSSSGFPFTAYLEAGDQVELTVDGGWSAGGAQSWVVSSEGTQDAGYMGVQPRLEIWWDAPLAGDH